MNSWTYKVRYFVAETDEELESCGLVVSENFTNAMKKISKSYGEDSILSVTIEWLDESELIELPEDLIGTIRKSIE